MARAHLGVAGSAEAPVLREDGVLDERVLLSRLLKMGQGIATFRGRDLQLEQDVVVKVCHQSTVPVDVQVRLEHEVLVLRRSLDRAQAPQMRMSRSGELLYLTMPFVEGIALAERLRRGPLSAIEAVHVARGVLRTLIEVHPHGVLHRDIKPSNIIVDEGEPLTRASLVGFGLSRCGALEPTLDLPVGTALYVAPEQAGLLRSAVDGRADLYALGVTLYECLAGHPPFQGRTVGELLRQHLTAHAPRFESLGIRVPHALDGVVQRLLRKTPTDRYQSAEAVLADIEQLGAALERGEAEPVLIAGLLDRRQTLAEPAFVGRKAELEALRGELAETARGKGGILLVEAPSGSGKSRLLEELAQEAEGRGMWVLRGHGTRHDGQRPLQLLEGVTWGIRRAAHAEPGLVAGILERLYELRGEVGAALPDLAELMGEEPPLSPEEGAERRQMHALSALLDALGTPSRPALLLFDDCQWADPRTLKLLAFWHEQREPGRQRHVLLAATFEAEEAAAGSLLAGFPRDRVLALRPLQDAEVRELVASMAGVLPEPAKVLVTQLAQGNPFFAQAILQGLVEISALVPGPDRWSISPEGLTDPQMSRRAIHWLRGRLDLLSAETLHVLSVGAVIGRDFELDDIMALTTEAPAGAVAALEDARRRHILWSDGSGTRWTLAHDQLREALLDRLGAEDRRGLHRLAALRLAELDPERVFEIAYHFDEAVEPLKALPCAMRAAQLAREQHALEIAERNYRIAEKGVSPDDVVLRQTIAEGLGDVMTLSGRHEQAAMELTLAHRLAQSPTDRARVDTKLAELAMRRESVDEARRRLEQALGGLGRLVPRSSPVVVALVLREVLVHLLHLAAPRLFVGRREMTEADRTAIRLYSLLSYVYMFAQARGPLLWAHLSALNLAERHIPTQELAQAYANHMFPISGVLGWHRVALVYGEKSLAIRRSFRDRRGQGQSLYHMGSVLYFAGRVEEAAVKQREAVALLERAGDVMWARYAIHGLAGSSYSQGRLAEAVTLSQRAYRQSEELGDLTFAAMNCLEIWALASGGKVPEALLEEALGRPSNVAPTMVAALQSAGVQRLRQGRPAEAAALFLRGISMAEHSGLFFAPMLRIYFATALRMEALELPPSDARLRRSRLQQARAAAARAIRGGRVFNFLLPYALRESGLAHALLGDERRARRLLDRSLALAERSGQRIEHAQTLLARGRMGLNFGWLGAEKDLAAAREALRSFGADFLLDEGRGVESTAPKVTLSLVDRLTHIADAGRRITSARNKEMVWDAVCAAGERLLRGDDCLILEVLPADSEPRAPDVRVVRGAPGARYSRALLQRALSTGRPATEADLSATSSDPSMLLTGVRSVLCAPIRVRDRAEVCFYLSHREVGDLFGKEEERLAEYIASLAGAALENARAFTEIQELHRRVAEHAQKLQQMSAAMLRVQEDERSRIALALHDDAGGTLMALGLRLDEISRSHPDAAADIVESRRTVARLMADLRQFSHDLRPQALDLLGLPEALRDLAHTISNDQLRVDVEIGLPEPGPLQPDVTLTVYRIVQAALTNVVRHAKASEARVRLCSALGELHASIEDDGVGFDPERVSPRAGIGLAGMRERVSWFGGRLWIEASPGRGTRIDVRIPIQASHLSSASPDKEPA